MSSAAEMAKARKLKDSYLQIRLIISNRATSPARPTANRGEYSEKGRLMELLKAVLLGFLQGITEFLPISSSGHLSVFQHFFGSVGGTDSLMFTVLLHIGTLAAVVAAYCDTIIELAAEFFKTVRDIFTGRFHWKEMNENRRMLFLLVVSCLPLLVLLVPVSEDRRLCDVLGSLCSDGDIVVEGVCFIVTAVLLLLGSRRAKTGKKSVQMDTKSAFFVGVAQLFAAGFPGISRSGSTVSVGMLCGVRKEYMVRYSFILGIPAILAANILELKNVAVGEKIDVLPALLGVVTAAIVGFAAIKLLEWLVRVDKFKIFGYYCLAVGVLVIVADVLQKFVIS